jgi:cytochrome c-type biogenesis protein
MDFSNIPLYLAFLAGLVSFLSPCVFALVPAYVGYLSGRSLAYASGGLQNERWITFTHGLAFVTGFSVVFILLGVAAAALGGFLYDLRFWLTKIGGVVIVLFGLHMLGVINIKYLNYDLRPQTVPDRNRGYLSSAMMGVFFSAGWSPCVGPVLGAILTFVINGGSVSQGALMLTFYSMGLAVPFLLASLGVGWVTEILMRYGKVMFYAEKAMGIFLIIIGVMLFFGKFETLAGFGYFVDFGI